MTADMELSSVKVTLSYCQVLIKASFVVKEANATDVHTDGYKQALKKEEYEHENQ